MKMLSTKDLAAGAIAFYALGMTIGMWAAHRDEQRQSQFETKEAFTIQKNYLECAARLEGNTVIYEEQAPSSGVAAAALLSRISGIPVDPQTRPVPRWVIPGRVEPAAAAGQRGGEYVWISSRGVVSGAVQIPAQ